MRGLGQGGYKVHFETFLLDVFFRRDASLHTLYPAVLSRPKYIRDFFPLAKFEIGGRRGENYIEQRSRIRQFYF